MICQPEIEAATGWADIKIYCEQAQHIQSEKSKLQADDKVNVRVWRDEIADGNVATWKLSGGSGKRKVVTIPLDV